VSVASLELQINMFFLNFLASLISVTSLAKYVAADLRITANHHSFGGVNYPSLQYLEPNYRDTVIRAIVKTNARVIRLFSKYFKVHNVLVLANPTSVRPDKDHPDVCATTHNLNFHLSA
jgi:hypothetical protein